MEAMPIMIILPEGFGNSRKKEFYFWVAEFQAVERASVLDFRSCPVAVVKLMNLLLNRCKPWLQNRWMDLLAAPTSAMKEPDISSKLSTTVLNMRRCN